MKILLVQDADWTKKGPHQQHHLMELLSIKGHEIVVIGFDQLWSRNGIISRKQIFNNVERFYDGAKIKFIKPFFIKIKILDYISFLFSSRSEVKRSVYEFKPDIIIGVTSVLSNYWAMYYAKKNNIPFIYYWTDVTHTLIPSKIFQEIAKIIEKNIIKNSSGILAINEVLRDQMINMGAKDSITEIIPAGIDFKRFDPSKISSHKMRLKYNINDEDIVIFFMGWIYEFSGLKEVLLELFKLNKSTPNNIKLMVVGEGDFYLELKNLIKNLKMENKVIMTGLMPYKDIPKLLGCADICILPAFNNEIMRDIVPIKIYEYLAMNKPVVSTRLPGVMKEFGSESGVLYADGPEDVLRVILGLEDSDMDIHKSNAINFIKNYDWDIISCKFEDYLKDNLK